MCLGRLLERGLGADWGYTGLALKPSELWSSWKAGMWACPWPEPSHKRECKCHLEVPSVSKANNAKSTPLGLAFFRPIPKSLACSSMRIDLCPLKARFKSQLLAPVNISSLGKGSLCWCHQVQKKLWWIGEDPNPMTGMTQRPTRRRSCADKRCDYKLKNTKEY